MFAAAPLVVAEEVEVGRVVGGELAEFAGEGEGFAEVWGFGADGEEGVEGDGVVGVFPDEGEETVFSGFLVWGGGAEVVVSAAAEEGEEDGGLEVVGELGGDLAEGVGGGGWAFFHVFDEAEGVSAFEIGAGSGVDEVEEAIGGGVASGAGFG